MQSSKWGPKLNSGLFYIAAGYDFNETPKHIKDEQYKLFFKSIGDVLPCRFCRDSYKIFYDELNIDRYLRAPSCGLIKFYYDMRNLINDKLKKQEEEALKKEFDKLKLQMSTEDPRFWEIMREKGHKICYTKPAPLFEQVVADLMKHRAGCNQQMKTCREPLLNNMYPPLPDVSTLNLHREGPSDRELYSGGKKRKVTKKSVKRRPSVRKHLSVKRKR